MHAGGMGVLLYDLFASVRVNNPLAKLEDYRTNHTRTDTFRICNKSKSTKKK